MTPMDKLTAFFQGRLSTKSRVLMVVATLALLPAVFLPTWTITLHAPQYPDGLAVQIYPHTVKGQIGEVNVLNHYIGMQEIHADEFPEFRFIPFFILRFFGFALCLLYGIREGRAHLRRLYAFIGEVGAPVPPAAARPDTGPS